MNRTLRRMKTPRKKWSTEREVVRREDHRARAPARSSTPIARARRERCSETASGRSARRRRRSPARACARARGSGRSTPPGGGPCRPAAWIGHASCRARASAPTPRHGRGYAASARGASRLARRARAQSPSRLSRSSSPIRGSYRAASRHIACARSSCVHSPGADAGEVGGAERRRLGDLRHHDRHAEHVGLELHQPAVGGRAAVGACSSRSGLPDAASMRAHGVDGLVGDRLERRAREVRARRCRASARRSSRARRGPSAASPGRSAPARSRRRRCPPASAASSSVSAATSMIPSPSRSHWTAAPVTKIAASSA